METYRSPESAVSTNKTDRYIDDSIENGQLNKAPKGKSGSSMGKFIEKIDDNIYKSDDASKKT